MNISIMMPDGSIYNSGVSSRTFVKPKKANNKSCCRIVLLHRLDRDRDNHRVPDQTKV